MNTNQRFKNALEVISEAIKFSLLLAILLGAVVVADALIGKG